LATGWAVRRSHPGGGEISAPRLTGLKAHPVFCTVCTGSFPEIKELGSGVNHPPHLPPKLKKE